MITIAVPNFVTTDSWILSTVVLCVYVCRMYIPPSSTLFILPVIYSKPHLESVSSLMILQ